MRAKILGILFAAVLSAASASAAAEGTLMTWTVEGVQREALVFAPTAGSSQHPVVFSFHGHGGNMNGPARSPTAFQNLWPEAIVVYPQGLPTPVPIDPMGRHPGWQTEAGQLGNRDLKFFDAMVATLRQKFSVDSKRIYVSGFSNGAMFSYLLWSQRGASIAALGICAGRLSPSEHLTTARPVLVIGGEADEKIPIADQQQSIEAARQVDGATGAGQSCGPMCTLYASTSGTPVVTRIHPRGHVYPPWAGPAFVEFFKAHTL